MSLLSGEQILERLGQGEIFRSGTWREKQVRPAGYDLRISTEVRAFNNQIFSEGHEYGETLHLEPGDTAYVLSFERFCMPWNLAANLGVRFRFSRRGLSVLTGLLVDPGYGKKLVGNEWKPEGAALHFFVVNISADSIPIVLGPDGDAVLSVQFLETAELKQKKETSQPGDVEPSSALWAFHSMRSLQEQADQQRDRVDKEFEEVKKDMRQLTAIVERTHSATENIVVFGVFLLAVTLIGVTATILIQTLANRDLANIIDNLNRLDLQGFSATAVTLAAIFAIGASVVAMILAFTRGFAWVFGERMKERRIR